MTSAKAESARIGFTFDFAPMTAADGQTIAAALIANDVMHWRTTRRARSERGVFCGIGVCFDCLVHVNADYNVRACVQRVRDGDVVLSELPPDE